jgi:hypothetical protein
MAVTQPAKHQTMGGQGFGEQGFFATCFQGIDCKPDRTVCKTVLFGGEMQLRQRFINLSSTNTNA